jgi:hypothetical protein
MSRKYKIDQMGLNEESFCYFSDGGIVKDSITEGIYSLTVELIKDEI